MNHDKPPPLIPKPKSLQIFEFSESESESESDDSNSNSSSFPSIPSIPSTIPYQHSSCQTTQTTQPSKRRRIRKKISSESTESNNSLIPETFRELNGLFAAISSAPALVFSELEIKTVASKLLKAAAALQDLDFEKEKEAIKKSPKTVKYIRERLMQRKSVLEGADAMFGTLQVHPDLLEMFSKNQKELANLLVGQEWGGKE